MSNPTPIYTAENCRLAYQLYWSLALFWKVEPRPSERWLTALTPLTEKDGVRILEHRFKKARTSQFLLSTKPHVSPSEIIRSVKGRLQHEIRHQLPQAFKRNYSIKSVGPAKEAVIQEYLDSQLDHHPMADPQVQRRLSQYQIDCPDVDLTAPRRSSFGEFTVNLHVVLVNQDRWCEIDDERLTRLRDMIAGATDKKGHLLSKARLLSDHVHLTLGCGVTETPADVALGYLNNLAYAYGMRSVFQYGAFVGTFGKYDLGAIRQALARSRSNAGPWLAEA